MNKFLPLLLLFSMAVSGCIGTDIVEENVVEKKITITKDQGVVEVGDTVTFTGTYFDQYGYEEEAEITWGSSNENIFIFTGGPTGIALDSGNAEISATTKNTTSTLLLEVFPKGTGPVELIERKGTFVKASGGYDAEGTAILQETDDGGLILKFREDFSTSNGPSVYVFLANKTSGPFNYKEGGNVVNATSAQITPNKLQKFSGAMEFAVPQGVVIDDYDYVVLYCILGPVFGYAELEKL